MTPKEKAKELVLKYIHYASWNCHNETKQCAIIAVDEIVESLEINSWQNRKVIDYYEEVKEEIEKL